jgi:mono/diheme cytochrome c family protein
MPVATVGAAALPVGIATAIISLSACFRGSDPSVAAPEPRLEKAEAAVHSPPAKSTVVGDHQRGWNLFLEHCANCHGETRRGARDGLRRVRSLRAPADLRNPILLASRTDDDLAQAILAGGSFVGRSRYMPGFAEVLSEQDVLDLIALLRGDAIDLKDCFPSATRYVGVSLEEPGPLVLAAYEDDSVDTVTPTVLADASKLSAKAKRVGFVMFAELELKSAGNTPVGFLSDPAGKMIGMRVALPEPGRSRARQDLEDTVIRKIPRLPKLRRILEAGKERLSVAATN